MRHLDETVGHQSQQRILDHLRPASRPSWAMRITWRAAAYRRRASPRLECAPGLVVPHQLPVCEPALSGLARRDRSAGGVGTGRHPDRRRRGVSAAQDRALRSARAVDGNVLIYVHKELELEDVRAAFPAEHYVIVDDKLRLLAAIKSAWGRSGDHRLPAPGSLRARPGHPPPVSRRRHHRRSHRRSARAVDLSPKR